MCSDYTFFNRVIPNPYQITQQNITYIFNLTDKTLQIDCLENRLLLTRKAFLFDRKVFYFTDYKITL